MKTCFEIAFKYMKYYKNKSISILFSIVLAVTLIVGIGTMYNSAKHANIVKVRQDTADFHLYYNVNQEQLKVIQNSNIEKLGITQYYDSANYPNTINLVCSDENYIKMCNSKVLEGKMPAEKGEIALEKWVIQNFNFNSAIGTKVTFNLVNANKSETFTLVGILKDIPQNKENDTMEGFLALDNSVTGEYRAYVKFDEQLDIREQNALLTEKMNFKTNSIGTNHDLLDALNVQTYFPKFGTYESFCGIVQFYHLDLAAIIFMISLFSAFVVYSVFQISTMQRISEYGLLEALGTNDPHIFTILFSELMSLLIIGFPIGSLLGILCAKIFNHKFSSVFIGEEVKSSALYISTSSIIIGFIFLTIIMLAVAMLMMKRLKKLTPIEAIQKSFKQKTSKLNGNKIYTLRRTNVINIISFKYIVRKKSAFIGILLSLSLGGTIFICSGYAAELTKTENELSVKIENNMSSDYQIGMTQFSDLNTGISKKQVQELKNIDGVYNVSPINYLFGGVILDNDLLRWKEFFKPTNEYDYFKNSFNGIYTKLNDNSNNYLLKSGIYGYNDDMLNIMKDYIYQGEINIDKMKQDNLILFKLPMDGTGSFEALNVRPGDTITVKYQKDNSTSAESLKFQDGLKYVEKQFIVGATVKRVAASNTYFIGDSGGDIIMTNDQFQSEFGIDKYNMVNITKQSDANHIKIANNINNVVKNIPKCSMRDLTIEIAANNAFLNKQLMMVYGITLILFIISLFNILNNISYNVLSRMNEFGILRAMGITDQGFWKMIIREGLLYGISASAITILISLICQGLVFFVVKRVYLYIDPVFTINIWTYLVIVLMNIIIGIIATVIPSYKITKMSIVEEIKRQE